MDYLVYKYKFKLKGTGHISFHIRCDFFHESNVVLCFSPCKYIDKMVQTYMTMFGKNPKVHKSFRAPLEQVYHPYLDTLELLDN